MRLIDADELKIDFGFTWDDIAPTREEMFEIIDRQPTVDAVEVVHGEWNQIEIIDDDSGNGVNDDASQCSVCGDVFDSYYWAKTYFNYCPNCGAKMEVNTEK